MPVDRISPTRRLRVALVVGAGALLAAACSSSGGAQATAPGAVDAPVSVPVSSVATTTVPATPPPPASTVTTSTTQPGPARCLAAAPLSRLAARLVVATASQGGLPAVVDAVAADRLGGVVVIGDADAGIGEALAPLAGHSPTPVIAVDEEGGAVQRLEAVIGAAPSARRLARLDDPAATRDEARERARAVAALGFTVVLAPVADVGVSAGLRSRTFGDDPEVVATQAAAFAAGLSEGGVLAVAKHFPGHGATPDDSHRRLPVTTPLDEMRTRDLVPFARLADRVPVVMVGHLVVPGLTGDLPATFSPAAVALLRDEMSFDGVIMSDDLSMGALSAWTVPEAAVLAVAAGQDLVIAGGLDTASASVTALERAVVSGALDRSRLEEAAGRILAAFGDDPCTLGL
ncbi:MAG: glycoside hydrolase family 3 protein [Actinomyces sp.]|nr:MAG: glycoside hydrolase family 3 protein [Actinomyces sp.]